VTDLYVRGTDNSVWTRRLTSGGLGDWTSLRWIVSSPVAPVSPASGTLDLFARGTDDALWVLRFTNGAQGVPTSMGGVLQ
jgi:hypothetical protein